MSITQHYKDYFLGKLAYRRPFGGNTNKPFLVVGFTEDDEGDSLTMLLEPNGNIFPCRSEAVSITRDEILTKDLLYLRIVIH